MTLLNGTYFSEIICNDINFSILYPKKSKQKPKLLYFLHGSGDNETSIYRKTIIETILDDYNLAVVFPQANRSYYTNMAFGRNYYDHFVKDFFSYIENMLNVSKKIEDRFIGGISMGGYGAMKIAYSNPNLFSKCFALSPVTDINNMKNNLISENRKAEFKGIFGSSETVSEENDLYQIIKTYSNKSIKLYRSCGTDDFLFNDNEKFTVFLDEQKLNHKYKKSVGNHNWDFWNTEIPKAIKFLMEE